jgi:hypothetical protein
MEYAMKLFVTIALTSSLLAAQAFAQEGGHDGHHPPASAPQAQQKPPEPAAGRGGPMAGMMGGMMEGMGPMMQKMMQGMPEHCRTTMQKMPQACLAMMDKMMQGGPVSAAPGAVPHAGHTGASKPAEPHLRAYAEAMDKMHADMGNALRGDADEAFARGMIPHHQAAIDMARVVLQYGKDEQMRKLATDVIREQAREIAEMADWLRKREGK